MTNPLQNHKKIDVRLFLAQKNAIIRLFLSQNIQRVLFLNNFFVLSSREK